MREFSVGGDLSDAAGTGEGYLTLKLEPDLYLRVPHRLSAGGGAEAGVPRLQKDFGSTVPSGRYCEFITVRSVGLRVLHRRVPVVDHDNVEGVEGIEPELELAGATYSNVPRERQVHGLSGHEERMFRPDSSPRLL